MTWPSDLLEQAVWPLVTGSNAQHLSLSLETMILCPGIHSLGKWPPLNLGAGASTAFFTSAGI